MKHIEHYSYGGGEDIDWANGQIEPMPAPTGYDK